MYSQFAKTLATVHTGSPILEAIENFRIPYHYLKNAGDVLDGTSVIYQISRIVSMSFILEHPSGYPSPDGHSSSCEEECLPWDLDGISSNPNLTIDFIVNKGRRFLMMTDSSLCMERLSYNPNITIEFVDNHRNGIKGVMERGQWDISGILTHVSGDDLIRIIKTPEEINIYASNIPSSLSPRAHEMIFALSKNVNLTPRILLDNPKGVLIGGVYKKWIMNVLTLHTNIPFDFILKYPLGFGCGKWSMLCLNHNKNITLDFIFEYSKKIYSLINQFPLWNLPILCSNGVIPIKYILEYPEGLTLSSVPERKEVLRWPIASTLKRHPMSGASEEDIEKYINITHKQYLNMEELSRHVPIKFILNHQDGIKNDKGVLKPWIISCLFENPDIDYDFLCWLLEKPLSYRDIQGLFKNPYTGAKRRREKYIYSVKEEAARDIWYKGWTPYYFDPNKRGKGFDKDKEVFLEHLFHKE